MKSIITGHVVKGDQLGIKLGFPTANILQKYTNITLPVGVYLSNITVLNKKYFAITHIGNRATLNESNIKIEVHILDFDQNIYGEKIEITLLDKIRDTQKFNSLKELQSQISNDVQMAYSLLVRDK